VAANRGNVTHSTHQQFQGLKTMKIGDAFPSNYLKADEDVPEEGDLVVTVSRTEMATLGQGRDAKEKAVLFFKEVKKGLVLNKTNWQLIAKALGSDDTDDWEGRRIALYSTDVEFKGEFTRGIRVRAKEPKPANGKTKPAKAAVAEEDLDDDTPY
jgi:hypothetical protein